MTESTRKETSETGDQIRCTKCGKLLAKNFGPGNFEIKCVRCGTLNTIDTTIE